jgi:hypothetical protein
MKEEIKTINQSTEELHQAIVNHYLINKSYSATAKEFSLGRKYITKVVKDAEEIVQAAVRAEEQQYVDDYKQLGSLKAVAEKYRKSPITIKAILEKNGISIASNNKSIKITRYTEKGEIIDSFESASAAAKYLIEEGITDSRPDNVAKTILRCSKNSLNTAYGFKWAPPDVITPASNGSVIEMLDRKDNLLQTFYGWQAVYDFLIEKKLTTATTIGGIRSTILRAMAKDSSSYSYFWRMKE